MNNEISEEAKRTLADLPRRKALQRLKRDGATPDLPCSVAFWRSRPNGLFRRMYKRPSTPNALAFCNKHKVSLDWLLCGDLQGLHRMTKEAKAEPPETTEAQRKEVTRLFLALSPQKQAIALGCMRELMTRSVPNG
jgi:hypothetical protein